ncbi:DUF3102 domain-containing protein [Mesorhizobium sp. M7A.F.Ca.CA.001.09.2.1]|uniref:DUF3102 domain-containing protein n=1 Tax=Mesorhizobium ciceri TaxID=39645 RepID=A0AB38T4U1_9HYPH|nr:MULTISPECIES: DUF3102 domain-containing protein [Mesorhizobium]RUY55477.1 DUF3102 domain-containing protein [Mesorhizobium sp. M7A.F.Ca.CA.001.13.2.1]MDF3216275.1 DUF3102 domain-containing protein [Mesorhizobium ciceri]RUY62996.1 DUF3102 domain-containing protein [Mesorhizobium sp. M7A.F.Ca.CA.001.05.1.1]RUY65225.1 DUF3102 domain-containing protein [Mesorhizobium sp. M7A.F.Ca.CA.001.13.1.1]RUY78066.1 DUF3102 domain-containing protein [Mesorhizobium sp. M7A.F.Ca.CA.001.09.2.1]
MSNRLPILASEAKKAHKDVGTFTGMAAVQALKAGEVLAEAKALCGHGHWAAWLRSTSISERSAQRYMLMHRAGLKPAIVADLGFAAAERYAGLGMKLLPAEGGAACLVFGDEDIDHVGLAYWWRATGPHVVYWCIQFIGEGEVLHLHHTIPIWLLGAMEVDRVERHDLYKLQPATQEEALDFITRFEDAA